MKNLMPLIIILFIGVSCEDDFNSDNTLSTDTSIGTAQAGLGDNYGEIIENPFIDVAEENTSTFSIDADGGSYANARRFLQESAQIPPRDAIRTEEFINYFNLDYSYPTGEHPIVANGEISVCPWNIDHKLVRIGIQAKDIPEGNIPPSNFVLLIDVSGSMASEDKLQLLKSGFVSFVDELDASDSVAIVVYAGQASVVLEATPGDQKDTIKNAINSLGSGGSTAGAQGIITAYDIAVENFIEGGNNRIIIGTDGDFNVGPSSREELITLIEEKRDQGIFLTVLGVGRGNLNDSVLEQIANKGNGNYEYLDTIEQLRKVFIYEYKKFFTVAKDVKIQVEFDELNVQAYRLIGYENRILDNADFTNDTEDAGEIGADQNITALYEIIPQQAANASLKSLTIDYRYKHPNEDVSIPLELDIFDQNVAFENASDAMQFTASAAAFAMTLRDSEYKGTSTYELVQQWLSLASLEDEFNFKQGLSDLIETASSL